MAQGRTHEGSTLMETNDDRNQRLPEIADPSPVRGTAANGGPGSNTCPASSALIRGSGQAVLVGGTITPPASKGGRG